MYTKTEMRGLRVLTVLILLAAVSPVAGANGADFYSWWTGIWGNFVDPNTGLTVFPTLPDPHGRELRGHGHRVHGPGARMRASSSPIPRRAPLLKDTELSFFHHNWIADSTLEGVVYTVRFNDLGIGVGGKFLSVPFTAYNEWGALRCEELHHRDGRHPERLVQLLLQLEVLRPRGGHQPEGRLPQRPRGVRPQPVLVRLHDRPRPAHTASIS